MDLFTAEPGKITATGFTIDGDEARHILRVMRKRVGDNIFFTDGQGWQYEGQITQTSHGAVQGEIVGRAFEPREPGIKLTLAFGLLKGSHNDFLVEKCTELGVSAFQPFFSRSSVVARPGPGRASRLTRIARGAMKQSLRTVCPAVSPPIAFADLLGRFKQFDRVWLAYEAATGRRAAAAGLKSGLLLIGPEGGFSRDEYHQAAASGAIVFSLGPRRLRSETAAIVGSSLIIAGSG